MVEIFGVLLLGSVDDFCEFRDWVWNFVVFFMFKIIVDDLMFDNF